MQCLNQILRSECPIVDKKRSDMLKLQGEFAVRLRQLEKLLLNALNESKGKILDDDSVIATLEKLKNEAEEVLLKSADNDKVKKEVNLNFFFCIIIIFIGGSRISKIYVFCACMLFNISYTSQFKRCSFSLQLFS